MSSKELKHKPLVEAILELRWPLQTPAPGVEVDPNYRLVLGRFSERIQSDYPFHEPLPTAQIPDEMAAHMPQHRFRTRQNAWPLVQIGPGIMTVNETDSYTWPAFQQRCEKAVASLFDAQPAREEFQVQDVALRYVDAVDVDFQKENVFTFLSEKLKTNVSLPESLFVGSAVQSCPVAFNWQVSFPHDEPGGIMTMRLAMGKRHDTPALIWETVVQTSKERLVISPSTFPQWLSKAHLLADDWFFKLIDGELERRFSGEN